MPARDELLIDLINRTEMEGAGPRLTVVAHGVVLTGRLTTHRTWATSVAGLLDDDSAPDEHFGEAFRREAAEPLAYPPVFLHLHGCQLISGSSSLPAALGEYFRVPLESVTAWSVR
ncbi:hypothetical protein DF268_01490 [Streptomyces sp. V2]|uniref:Uncharacterized protein n=1 Tax=Streptomyces niveiscabiei TaxID=164115 RepID=A0ABW9HQ97_9ACTN|nr:MULTISPECIES: hypothetical protein [Streptomyces]MDX3383911.1 hypothetical protein [Streptomyces niveiscabiei]PWG15497.1 hypothetical protein DF268_01490 [Streptomyces sp. V2]QZZ25802.1 hypothetical protein A7X85_05640 [Streptomyces sp. ST1015]